MQHKSATANICTVMVTGHYSTPKNHCSENYSWPNSNTVKTIE